MWPLSILHSILKQIKNYFRSLLTERKRLLR